MKIDDLTLKVLKNFSSINQSIQFREGNVLSTISPSKTIIASATLNQEFPSDFAIYDLSRFLSTLSLFTNPEIDVKDNELVISEGKKRLKYTFADPNTIIAPKANNKIKDFPVDVSFELEAEALQDVIKATGIMKLPEVSFIGDGTNVSLAAVNCKDPTSDTYAINIGETDKVFSFNFKIENLKLMPAKYSVDLASIGISRFKSDNLEYYIGIETTSTFQN